MLCSWLASVGRYSTEDKILLSEKINNLLRRIYPLLFTDPEGDSCFCIYQIRWKKNAAPLMAAISFSETFAKRRTIFLSVRKTVNIQGYSK